MERAMTHHDDTWIRTGALLAGLGVAGYYGARWLTAAPPAAAATLPPRGPTASRGPAPSRGPRRRSALRRGTCRSSTSDR
jgi:hypothetical protein